jgi:hypothetical protein
MVAFADGELAGDELDAAATQVQECHDCAELVADLRSLAVANRAMVTPARPHDLRLSVADAHRLAALGPEPHAPAARLGLDMTATPATLSDHASHDPELIAAAVGGALEPSERRLTETWLAGCAPCAELHVDLLAIASAQRALPTPSRPRDFQLTLADAHRLRPRGLRAFLAAIGSSRDAFSKPLAVGLTTLGLAGLLVGTLPSLGQSAGTAVLSTVGAPINAYGESKGGQPEVIPDTNGDGTVFGGQDLASAAASAAPPAAASASAAAVPVAAGPEASPAASAAAAQVAPSAAPASVGSGTMRESAVASAAGASTGDDDGFLRLSSAPDGPSLLLIASIVLLVAGTGLFAARWAARRLRAS